MSAKSTLKEMKRKTYLAYHQDGLIDIVIGLSIAGFAISAALGSESSMLTYVPFLFFTPLKNRITVPRLGFVQFTPTVKLNEKQRTILIIVLAVLCLLGGLAAGFYVSRDSNMNAFYEQNTPLIFAVLGAVLLVIMGLVVKLKRLFIYAAAVILIIFGGDVLNIHPGIYAAILALSILLNGSLLLGRFLKKYPLTEMEGSGDYE